MVQTTEGKVFTVENYFISYENGRDNVPNLKQVSGKYRQKFNKVAPSESVMLAIWRNFVTLVVYCVNAKVLVIVEEQFEGCVLDQILRSPKETYNELRIK